IATATLSALGGAIGLGGAVSAECRLVSLLVSLATVGLVYLIGRFWGRRHGLIAMALYAVAMLPATVQSNPPQVFATFFLALAIFRVLRALTRGAATALILGGAWLGLGGPSKFPPLFFAGVLLLPQLLRPRSGGPTDAVAVPQARRPGEAVMARLW